MKLRMKRRTIVENVNVNKHRLLEALTINRQQHMNAYDWAMAGWQIATMDDLRRLLDRVAGGEHFSVVINRPLPVTHLRAYDTAIAMVEMSVDDVIELSVGDFRRLVMDDWEWKASWTASNSAYTSYMAGTSPCLSDPSNLDFDDSELEQ